MSVKAETILDQAAIIFVDAGFRQWTQPEGLIWINLGQKTIVRLKPDANPVADTMQLSAGTRQAIPSGRISLIRVVRNMGTDGATPGRVVRLVSQQDMDDQDPDWHATDSATEIDHYMYDEREPKAFFVYPPSDGNGHLDVVSAGVPSDVAVIGDNINLDDIYGDVLLDYVLFRGFSKNSESAVHRQRAMDHMYQFLYALGRQDMAEMIYSPSIPNQARVAGLMTTPATGGGS